MKKRHVNIPIFIPNIGCRHQCVFCDQKTISGEKSFDPGRVKMQIEEALTTLDPERDEIEIAFFGGSFTGLDRETMDFLLRTAAFYLETGKVSSLRLSTRPDMIDEEILATLKKYHVSDIELGIQSTDDKVLCLCRRGHTAKATETASELIKAHGFTLVGQMMTSLPGSSPESERKTAEDMVKFGVDAVRIYPLVVFENTPLAEMMRNGFYHPSCREDTISRAASLLAFFAEKNIPVLRIGLQASEALADPTQAIGGWYSPSLGEEVRSAVYLMKILSEIGNRDPKNQSLTVFCPPGAVSQVIGKKKCNLFELQKRFQPASIAVRESDAISPFSPRIEIGEEKNLSEKEVTR